jgi:hypothetical protein
MELWDFLGKNKEWLFSGGGLFVLGGTGALLKYWFFRKQTSNGGQIESCQANSVKLSQNNASEPSSTPPPAPVANIAPVIHISPVFNNTPVFNNAPAVANTPIANSAANTTTSPLTRISPITPDMIREALESAPPLLSCDVARHYVGLEVQWVANLFSANREGDDDVNVYLTMCEHNSHMVIFRVKYSTCRLLGVLKKGSPITVMGRIKEVKLFHTILEDVQLIFPNSPSDNRA